jgi:hypothetical protein
MSLSEGCSRHRWAHETFGGVEVGNRRRVRRVVAVVEAVASRTAGTVTEVFSDSADREGAYRLLSNEKVPSSALIAAMGEATARACAAHKKVYVAVDGSSLSLPDAQGGRGLGGVGTWKDYGRGLHVVTALALDIEGVAVGVLAQTWWSRDKRRTQKRCSRIKLAEKETRFMVSTAQDALAHQAAHCPDTQVVLVQDRGFDCWPVLRTANDGAHFIVRAKANRRLADGPRGGRRYLRNELKSQPVLGRYDVAVPRRIERDERTAHMQVQAKRVTIELRVSKRGREYVELNAVWAREVRGPRGASLSWLLLTTQPIDTFEQVLEIVRAYTFRWRIEEMHRVWKRGGGHVEDTQLRSREAIIKWATLHCAVATRALRLTQLARTRPDTPASEEFSQTEIDATILLRRKRTKFKLGDVPSLGDLVGMVADVGGYTGKSSGGPPGPTVIARGLERIGIGAEILGGLRKSDE